MITLTLKKKRLKYCFEQFLCTTQMTQLKKIRFTSNRITAFSFGTRSIAISKGTYSTYILTLCTLLITNVYQF